MPLSFMKPICFAITLNWYCWWKFAIPLTGVLNTNRQETISYIYEYLNGFTRTSMVLHNLQAIGPNNFTGLI